MNLAECSPAETVHFRWQGSWDWPVLLRSQSCPSSLRRSDVQRRGSRGSFLPPGLHQRNLGGPRKAEEAGADAPYWVALTPLKGITAEIQTRLMAAG